MTLHTIIPRIKYVIANMHPYKGNPYMLHITLYIQYICIHINRNIQTLNITLNIMVQQVLTHYRYNQVVLY